MSDGYAEFIEPLSPCVTSILWYLKDERSMDMGIHQGQAVDHGLIAYRDLCGSKCTFQMRSDSADLQHARP